MSNTPIWSPLGQLYRSVTRCGSYACAVLYQQLSRIRNEPPPHAWVVIDFSLIMEVMVFPRNVCFLELVYYQFRKS